MLKTTKAFTAQHLHRRETQLQSEFNRQVKPSNSHPDGHDCRPETTSQIHFNDRDLFDMKGIQIIAKSFKKGSCESLRK